MCPLGESDAIHLSTPEVFRISLEKSMFRVTAYVEQ
jgi:hypothetical protein